MAMINLPQNCLKAVTFFIFASNVNYVKGAKD